MPQCNDPYCEHCGCIPRMEREIARLRAENERLSDLYNETRQHEVKLIAHRDALQARVDEAVAEMERTPATHIKVDPLRLVSEWVARLKGGKE